jgi:hypothetical protein
LPKPTFQDLDEPSPKRAKARSPTPDEEVIPPLPATVSVGFEIEDGDFNDQADQIEDPTPLISSTLAPKSMQEMAEAAARQQEDSDDGTHANGSVVGVPPIRDISPSSVPPTPPVEKGLKAGRKRQAPTKKRTGTKRRRRRGSDEEDLQVDEDEKSSPSKRVKRASVVPTSTRTLRPRAAKIQAQLQRQLEEEELDKVLKED